MHNFQRSGWALGAILFLTPIARTDDRESLKPFIEKALKAIGAEKESTLDSWAMTAKSVKLVDGRETGRSVVHIAVHLPDRYRVDSERNEWLDELQIRTLAVIQGGKGWRRTNVVGKTEELSTDQVNPYKEDLLMQNIWVRGARLLTDPGFQLTSLKELQLGDKKALGIRLTHKEYPPVRLYFDKETARLVRLERNVEDEPSLGRTSETMFDSFRKANSIWIPHKRSDKAEGPSITESTVQGVGTVKTVVKLSAIQRVFEITEVKLTDKLDPKLFEKP